MTIRHALLATTLLLAACSQSHTYFTFEPTGVTVYVSPTGDDNNPGTSVQPIQTLAHARDLVRAMAPSATDDITILLAPGTYRLAAPLELTAQDSGQNNHTITYAAADPAAPAVLSGAQQITGWHCIDPAKNLWSAPAPAVLANTRQLFIDGRRAWRSRGRLPVDLLQTDAGYAANSALMSHWKNPADIEFVYTGGNKVWSESPSGLGDWTEPRIPVAAITGTDITMAQPCWNNSTKRVMLPASSPFKRTANLVGPASVGKAPEYVENAYELLGTPGEFYLDRATHTFFYTPRPGEDLAIADVEAPILETLLLAKGDTKNPIHNITFHNIQFSYATWLTPSSPEGFSEIQANVCVTGKDGYATQGLGDLVPNGTKPYGAWTKTPANVSVSFANHIQFLHDDFVHLGGAGLDFGNGSQDNVVQGCIFTDISGNALEVGGIHHPEADATLLTRDNQILNNHFYNTACEYHGGVAICVGYAQRTLIAHNQIDHQPYTGISLGWGGWPDKINQAGVPNNSQNNRVEANLIFDHLLLLADGGGIYTQGLTGPSLADGEKLIGNVIHDQFSSGHGIYTDNGCKNVSADNNILFHTNHDNWGSRHKDWYPIADGKPSDGKAFDAFELSNNYWQQGDTTSPPNTTLANNHLIATLDQAPQQTLRNAGLEPAYRSLLSQQFTPPAAPETPLRVAATLHNGTAFVTWNPPACEGTAPITAYTVTAYTGAKTTITAEDFAAKGYATLDNLAGAKGVRFTVTAINAVGEGVPSLPSAPISATADPAKPVAPPEEVFAQPGDGMASVHFNLPADLGDTPILAYNITIHPGDRKVILAGRKIIVLTGRHATFDIIDSLQNGIPYTFDIAAVTPTGEGQPATTKPVTPVAEK